MINDLNALYAAAKSEAKHRDEVYARFLNGNHPDANRVFNLHNHIVADLVYDYNQNGGKRDLSSLVKEDKESKLMPLKKAIATIETDIGTMTIYFHGAGTPLTAETETVCEELEYTPTGLDDATDAIYAMYNNGTWCLEWIEEED